MAKDAKIKAKRKKGANRQLIFRLAFIAFFVYTLVSFTMMQVDIAKRKELLADAQAQLNEETYINREITNILDSGENQEYIMRIAREKLGLVFPNEKVIVDFKRK